MLDLPKSNDISGWLKFMAGYRDPKTLDLIRKEAKAEEEFYGQDRDGGGNAGSGSRQCGSRKEGGTYATCPLGRDGMPLEHFVPCYPVKIVADDYNLANVGVKLVDIEEVCLTCNGEKPKKASVKATYMEVCPDCNGSGTETVTHVFDIVGQEYYPNVADFLEEARRMGVSRRLELEDARQYARLSKRSRLMLLHHKAVITNPSKIVEKMGACELARIERAGCPKGLGHLPYVKKEVGCSALYWNVLTKGLPITEQAGGVRPEAGTTLDNCHDARFVYRSLEAGNYRGYAAPLDVEIKYHLGIFAVFPLARIQVVDPDGSYQNRVERAEAARLDVESVEC